MELKGKHCLVTGGAGFIGSHLVDVLMNRGCNVRVVDNLSNGEMDNIAHHLEEENFKFVWGDITDPLDVERCTAGIDVVFHLACLGVRHAIAHPFENHRVNAEGTLLVLASAYRAKVERFVQCSSSEVYGTAQYVPMPESHPTNPCTIYGSSKLAGEAYARAYHWNFGMDTVIVRPFNTYGPRSHWGGDAGEMIPKSIVRALNKRPVIVFGSGSQTRDFTYVEDIARALVLAAENDTLIGQTMNVGSDSERSIKDVANKITEKISPAETKVKFLPERPGDLFRLFADSRKFTEACGWEPKVGFDEGLDRTIDFFRNHRLGLEGLMKIESAVNWDKAYL